MPRRVITGLAYPSYFLHLTALLTRLTENYFTFHVLFAIVPVLFRRLVDLDRTLLVGELAGGPQVFLCSLLHDVEYAQVFWSRSGRDSDGLGLLLLALFYRTRRWVFLVAFTDCSSESVLSIYGACPPAVIIPSSGSY